MENASELPTVFDTDKQYLGTVYAKALIGVGQSTGKTETLLEELGSLVNTVLPKLDTLRATLESPRVPFEAKTRLIDKALKGKATDEFVNFLKVLCRKNRFDCIGAIDRAATRLHNEASGKLEATLVTASQVDDSVKSRVKDQLEKLFNKKIELATQIDQSIIGGLVVRVGDTVFDGSLANQLKQVRRAAVERANLEIKKSIDRFAIEA